ncbi:MAG: helix-turn-helix transcriptional regulator [Candidatus Acidiferrales bacterium]
MTTVSEPRPSVPRPPKPRTEPASEADFLASVGVRVRKLRNLRGMTRKMVSHDAEVSERHLAQLESGEGNVSIVLLRRIAAALNISLGELFSAESEAPAQNEMIERLLGQVPAHRLEEVVGRLVRDFGCDDDTRRKRIALIGLRGAGKSTLGSLLARDARISFIELDREIEKDAGMPLAEIFSLYGQSGYRRIEKRALERILDENGNERSVISVGGGVVAERETYERLLSNCFTVWVKAQPEEHMSRVAAQGDFRAMAENNAAMDDLRKILEAREPLYGKADAQIDTSGDSIGESLAKLKQIIATSS